MKDARSWPTSVEAQALRGNVECVVRVAAATDVRVIHSPGHAGAARRYRDNLDNLIHLKPAEDDVLLAR